MPQNLFAACRIEGQLIAKRVRLDAAVQQAVADIFSEQEADFRNGVTSEVTFDGRWTPDVDEFLTIDVPDEATIFEATIQANAVSIQDLNTAAFAVEGIKALFTGISADGTTKVLVQQFTAQQVLETRFALFEQQNVFRRLTEPAFTMGSSLACIIEHGTIKFKSQQKLRSIINMLEIYRAATDAEVQDFARHANLDVADIAAFTAATNQTSRKLIHAVMQNAVLDTYTSVAIQSAADTTGLSVEVRNGRIVMPTENKAIKDLLQFLNESRYTGPLSGQPFVTNSQRPA